MKRFRKVIFWCHLAAGVFAGVVVLVMSVTGVLLAYERQIVAWADTRGYAVAPAGGAAALPVETLIARAREARKAQPATLTLRADPAAPAEVGYGREGALFLNPYTGEVLGEGARSTRAFFQSVTDWHRWLGASGERRAWGRAVTGACNLAFLFIVASGFYLWWPRNWSRASLRGVTWFRRGLSGKARDFNWHNVVGFWSAAPLFIVVLSAVVISYTWASNLVYRVAGEGPPAPRPQQQAQGNAQGRGQQTEVAKWEPFSQLTPGRRLRSYLRFAHTGEVFGLAGQTVAGLASAGGALLVWTGLSLAWRRWRAWARRRSNDVDGVAAPTGAAVAPAPHAE